MAVEQLPRQQDRQRLVERPGKITYLDQYRPTGVVTDFKEINFSGFKDREGNRVNTLLLDFEGTCVPHDGWDVDPEVIEKIKSANFENIAIVTNKPPKDEKSLAQLNWWAKQIGADIVFAPTDPSERKPSPVMLLKAVQHFGIRPDQALMVGDKLTADIASANYAGVKSVWRKERLGEEDLDGDRYGRRPVEKILFSKIKRRMGQPQWESKAAEVIQMPSITPNKDPEPIEIPDWVDENTLPLWKKSIVDGFNDKPKIELSQAVKDAIPPGVVQMGMEKIRGILGEVDPKYKKQFDEFMWEHGDKVGNAATLSRIPGALVVAGLILSDHPKAAQIAHGAFALTDGIDGWAKRKSKVGPSKKWARLDHWIDKGYSAVVEMALAKKGHISSLHLSRTARDIVNSVGVRPYFERVKKIDDTGAVLPGKVSTFAVSFAENFAMTNTARNHPMLNELIQWAATSDKMYSVPASARRWLQKDKHKKSSQASFDIAKEVLLEVV